MIIGGLQKTSLIDFPEKISAIIFTQGCNFRCGYCHNPELLNRADAKYSEEEIFEFLKSRVGKLDGVVITGGEPTLQKDLKTFIEKIKGMGFCVKLDTNGTNPEMLEDLINSNLLDYVAMDIKSSIINYEKTVSVNVNIDNIKKSINLLKNSDIKYEFRTTVLKSLISKEDFEQIGKEIEGAKKYYLQKFVSTKIYDENLKDEQNYSDEEFENIAQDLRKSIEFVGIR